MAIVWVVVGGCRSAPPPRAPAAPHVRVITTPQSATITVTHVDGARDDVDAIARVVPAALARVEAVGLDIGSGAVVVVHGSVDSFVAATSQTVDTIRAWTVPGRIDVLTLSSWAGRGDDVVERRLAHELCHLGLYQRVGLEGARALPRGLSEGVCSVIAEQGADRLPASTVLDEARAGRAVDFSEDSAFSYSLAHHVVAAAVACLGWSEVWRLVDDVAAGRSTVADRLGVPVIGILDHCPASVADGP